MRINGRQPRPPLKRRQSGIVRDFWEIAGSSAIRTPSVSAQRNWRQRVFLVACLVVVLAAFVGVAVAFGMLTTGGRTDACVSCKEVP